ncbi:MAG: hypothetical protein QXW41_08160 [Fervidicoccaceae archaeon]
MSRWCVIVEFKGGEKRFYRFKDIAEVVEFIEKHEIRHLRAELC